MAHGLMDWALIGPPATVAGGNSGTGRRMLDCEDAGGGDSGAGPVAGPGTGAGPPAEDGGDAVPGAPPEPSVRPSPVPAGSPCGSDADEGGVDTFGASAAVLVNDADVLHAAHRASVATANKNLIRLPCRATSRKAIPPSPFRWRHSARYRWTFQAVSSVAKPSIPVGGPHRCGWRMSAGPSHTRDIGSGGAWLHLPMQHTNY
jgi:hypothetical protein